MTRRAQVSPQRRAAFLLLAAAAVIAVVGSVTTLGSPRASASPRPSHGSGATALASAPDTHVAERSPAPSTGSPTPSNETPGPLRRFDVVVYGGTASGVMAAVAAARAGASVAVLEPTQHLGGMVSNGLSATDDGNRDVIGGLTRTFFERVRSALGTPPEIRPWNVVPSVAEATFDDMLAAYPRAEVFYGRRLSEGRGVVRAGAAIDALVTQSGERFAGAVFVDASYEGDLLMAAGASYTWGRESADRYGEPLAGVTRATARAAASDAIGPLPGIRPGQPGTEGAADRSLQPYSFRPCVTQDAGRIPFPRPPGYDARFYAAVLVVLADQAARTGGPASLSTVLSIRAVPGGRFDVNGSGWFSMDDVGRNGRYPVLGYAGRDAIAARTRALDQGLLYFLANDHAVPASVRTEAASYGLCPGEFTDNGGWPNQLYIRESVRLVGEYVMTQLDVQKDVRKPDSIGMGSYRIDAHYARRFSAGGLVYVEGGLDAPTSPYEIPYRSLVPASGPRNLVVTVDVSASHVAWASLRMEPQFMIMGEAGGTAAAMAAAADGDVHAVDVARLQATLRENGGVLHLPSS